MTPRLARGLCLALSLSAFGMYVWQIDRRPLWWDEGISVYFSLLPPVDLLRITAGDVHPPAYYLLLLAWMKGVGTHPFCVRVLSALVGVLLVPLMYVTGRRLNGAWTGLLAALCSVAAPFVYNYAREARMYSLGMVAAAGSAYALLRLLDEPAAALRWWAAYVTGIVVGLHTQYAFVFVPAAHAAAVWLAQRRHVVSLRRWLMAALSIGALFAPWMIYAAWQLRFLVGYHIGQGDSGGLHVNAAVLFPTLQQLISGYALKGDWLEGLAVVMALLLAAVGTVTLIERRKEAAAFLGLSLSGAVLLMLLLRRLPGEETFSRIVRQAFWGVPALWLLASVGAWRTFKLRRWAGSGLLLVMFAGLVRGLIASYEAPIDVENDYRPLVAQVRTWVRPGDAILTTYYWQDGYFESYARALPLSFYRNYYSAATASEFLEGVFASHARVWVANYQTDIHDTTNSFNVWLGHNAALAFEGWYGTSQLALFVREGAPASTWLAHAAFDKAIGLDYSPLRVSLHPGEFLSLDLRWHANTRLDSAYTVFVHLGQSDQAPIAQSDSAPAGGFEPTLGWQPGQVVIDRRAFLVPLDAPPGVYQLYAGLYDSATGSRLLLTTPSGCDTADSVCLGSVEIVPAPIQTDS